MKNKILSLLVIILLISGLFLLTGCGNKKQENQNVETTENTSNTENNTETSSAEDGIEVGNNILKYGTYEGKDLAKGATIILNSDKTFEYKDDKNNSGTGTYEVKNEEIEDPEGKNAAWVIEFDSIVIASDDSIPVDKYMLFTQTGDISDEEASLNFDYVEDVENTDNTSANTNANNTLSALEKAQTDTFNAKFEQYEGEQSGVKVRTLLTAINSSNASDTENTVTVEYNGKEYSSATDISNLSSQIASGMTYNVTLEYENEMVSKVVIEND